MKPILITLAVVVGLIGLAIGGWVLRYAGEAAEVAYEETSPRALLKKYEWFKDAAADLDAKHATIKVYDQRSKDLEADYEETPRKDWPRDDRQQMSQWNTEKAGVVASYNSLASEYNSQMAKINYAFTNVGELPKGAEKPLPREYREYKTD